MSYSNQVDLLEPIDMSEHLDKIELYLGQVCAIAGISKMQLDYWTNKAQIPTKGKKQRIYDMDAVETVMLIKQAKDKGLNLGAAIDARAGSATGTSARSSGRSAGPRRRLRARPGRCRRPRRARARRAGRAREHLEMPVLAVIDLVQPRVQRHEPRPLDSLQPPDQLREQPQRGRQQVAAQTPGSAARGAISSS